VGRRRGARIRRRHGIALARADRRRAEQRARRPHGQRDDEPAIHPAGRRGARRERVRVSRDRRRVSRRSAADDCRQRRSIRVHPGPACVQLARARIWCAGNERALSPR
jgi:hypothetical protein